MYDLIGDIHGHADELAQLLQALGYEQEQGTYRHAERRVIFLGDFVDRGPKIRQVLEIVRLMVRDGHALAVLGNHEWNALAFHTEDPDSPGEYLRPRTPKNAKQQRKTLEQLRPEELAQALDWFRTLPLWLDLEGLRVVHACWDGRAVDLVTRALAEHGGITPALLHQGCKCGNALFTAVEVLLKGKEAPLPPGMSFQDKDGHVRAEIRTRWYLPPEGQTYRTYALQSDEIPCDLPLEETVIEQSRPVSSGREARVSRALLAFGPAARTPRRQRRVPGLQRHARRLSLRLPLERRAAAEQRSLCLGECKEVGRAAVARLATTTGRYHLPPRLFTFFSSQFPPPPTPAPSCPNFPPPAACRPALNATHSTSPVCGNSP